MANRLGRARLLSHCGIDKPQTAPSQHDAEAAYDFTLSELFQPCYPTPYHQLEDYD
jgi:hypothetical protein